MGDSMKNKKKLIAVIISLISIDSVSAMEVVDCGGLGSVPYVMIRFIGRIVNIIKVIVPVILIIMGMIDMAKATTASDEKQMQTSRKMFIKRIIYAVMVLFVVSIVQLLFTILQTSVFQKENNLLGCVSCVIGNDCDSEEIDLKETTATSTGSKGSKTKKIKVTRVVITSKKSSMKVGDKYTVTSKAMPINASNTKLTYKSSKPSVATISSTGKIKAKKTGTTTITVQSSSNKSAKDSFKLTIKDSLDSKRQKVIDYAKKFLGNPYVYGGTSLTHGTDCSGFTMGVYKHFGYNLPRTSGSQSGYGKKVSSLSNAKPGDLLFYSNGTRINHVALYMGNNKVIHASNPSTGIKTTSPANYRTIAKIRRVIY